MAKMVEITCKCGCNRKKMVRLSDVKEVGKNSIQNPVKQKHKKDEQGNTEVT